MARPQKFDEQEIISKAMLYFWEHGFSGSSIQQLLGEMGVSRGTLYGSVGDKDALFKRCLQRYSEMARQLFTMTLLNAQLPPYQRMLQFLQLSFLDSETAHLGCLMVNTLCEDERAVLEVKSLASSVMSDMENGFLTCFQEMVDQKQSLTLSPSVAAGIMATQLKGARVRQREGVSNQTILSEFVTLLNQLTQ
ncbi:TetR/AcrR family transcriptional regulator [Litoribacillus peritrichatus]|uniref:HTH tetR-type domain-containing protein n=1 Tax=Litoribacillus peritrichatus TaxID=718191 RepID=A0ABP7MAI4_9GAMM